MFESCRACAARQQYQVAPRVDPANVKQKIEETLKRHAAVEAETIQVTVHDNSKVLLAGKLGSWDERTAVENAAWSAPGVSSVEDRLTIA
jgi:osmotically-inducible protein OsmY